MLNSRVMLGNVGAAGQPSGATLEDTKSGLLLGYGGTDTPPLTAADLADLLDQLLAHFNVPGWVRWIVKRFVKGATT